MDQDLLIQHLKKSFSGRLRLNLFKEISGSSCIPDKEAIESFIFEKYQLGQIVGDLYLSILLLTEFNWKYYRDLSSVANIKALLKALEKYPFSLEDQFFIEISQCPQPLPENLGVLITCSELKNVDHGFVYSVYLIEENSSEELSEGIYDYIEVRACESMPEPIICAQTIEGQTTSDLRQIADSLTIQVALKSLYFLLDKYLKEKKKCRQSEIVKSTKLMPISDNLSARFLRQASGKVELALIIEEEASAEELRSAWAKIDSLRIKLREQQGTDLNQIEYSLLYNYYQMHKHDWSYNLIAMDINYDCLVNLCQASDEIIDVNAKTINSLGFTNAYQLLQSVRMKEKDILDWLINGLHEIRNGNAPWSPKVGPVDRQRVRDALRQWERAELSKKVIIRKPPKKEKASLDIFKSPLRERYTQMAKELLRRTFPDLYDEYIAALTQTITKTGYIGYFHAKG